MYARRANAAGSVGSTAALSPRMMRFMAAERTPIRPRSHTPDLRRVRRRRGLVHHEPIQPELPYGLTELREVDRFAHVAVRAEAVACHDVLLLDRRRQDDDRENL